MNIEHWAVKAMEEMHAEGLPVKKFEYGAKGYDFFFGRGLNKSEQKKAQAIANKYLPTQYSWHSDAPNTACTGRKASNRSVKSKSVKALRQ